MHSHSLATRATSGLFVAALAATLSATASPVYAEPAAPQGLTQAQIEAANTDGIPASAEEIAAAKDAATGTRSSIQDFEKVLPQGRQLELDEAIYSSNYDQKVVLENGALVKYTLVWWVVWVEDWAIDTGDATRLQMQRDGNLVAYTDGDRPTWSSRTAGKPDGVKARAELRNNGEFVVMHGKRKAWSSDGDADPVEPDPDPKADHVLKRGEKLKKDQFLLSKNEKFKFILQRDGNAVVYNTKNNKALWSTKTAGKKGAKHFIMQGDGNAVLYNKKDRPLWSSKTSASKPKNPRMIMRNNGKLDIMHGKKVVWSSANDKPKPKASNKLKKGQKLTKGKFLLSKNKKFKFILQRDGNAVVYNTKNNKALWSTRTAGKKGAKHLIMQGDGNAVLYNKRNKPLWDSGTGYGDPKNPRMIMRNNGVLDIMHGPDIVWTTEDWLASTDDVLPTRDQDMSVIK